MPITQEAQPAEQEKITGGCLCGAIRYEITGTPGAILNCHCATCRRFHGHYVAYSGVKQEDLLLQNKEGLQWFRSTTDESPNVYRGFCRHCGTSLLWHPRDAARIWLTLGSMDNPPALETIGHVWVSQKGSSYTITDSLPQFAEGLPDGYRYW